MRRGDAQVACSGLSGCGRRLSHRTRCVDQVLHDLDSASGWRAGSDATVIGAATSPISFAICQVTEVNGKSEPFLGYHDVVTLPAAASEVDPSVVKVIIPFTDPVILGEFSITVTLFSTKIRG